MKARYIVLIAATTAIVSQGIIALSGVNNAPQPASAAVSDKYDGDCTGKETEGRCADKPFIDHSNCQYPDRWSNPANGCDNSDPAVPECIKSFSTKEGEDACIAAFIAQNTQPAAPVVPTNPNQCGGK